jgi:hypothetical protein
MPAARSQNSRAAEWHRLPSLFLGVHFSANRINKFQRMNPTPAATATQLMTNPRFRDRDGPQRARSPQASRWPFVLDAA